MRRRPTLMENKLVLLYILRKVGEMTNQQALRFVVENDIMDYIDLQLALAELLEKDMLTRVDTEFGLMHTVSGEGVRTLEMFMGNVPPSRLKQVDDLRDAWARRFKLERTLPCTYRRDADGLYQASMRVLEPGMKLMDLQLMLPEREMARQVCENYPARADRLYAQLINLLTMPEEEFIRSGDEH